MAYSPTSPVTGGAQTGFTAPTYTLTSMQSPDGNGTSHAVTAIGGTQAGVNVHTVSCPFRATFWRPKNLKPLPPANAVNGVIYNVGKNKYSLVVTKGLQPAANQPYTNGTIEINFSIPAGADTYDAANVRALYSLAIGLLNQQSAGLGDTGVTGI